MNAYEENDELRGMWVKLLAGEVETGVSHPIFLETLKRMGPRDARVFARFYGTLADVNDPEDLDGGAFVCSADDAPGVLSFAKERGAEATPVLIVQVDENAADLEPCLFRLEALGLIAGTSPTTWGGVRAPRIARLLSADVACWFVHPSDIGYQLARALGMVIADS